MILYHWYQPHVVDFQLFAPTSLISPFSCTAKGSFLLQYTYVCFRVCLFGAYLFLHCSAVLGDYLDVYLSHQNSLDVYASVSNRLSLQYCTLPFWELYIAIPQLYFVQWLYFPSMLCSSLLLAGPLFAYPWFYLCPVYSVLSNYFLCALSKLRKPPWASGDQSHSQLPYNSDVLKNRFNLPSGWWHRPQSVSACIKDASK